LRDRVRNPIAVETYTAPDKSVYKIRIGKEGASAYNDEGRLVASVGRLVNLVVSLPYQKKGLGTALLVAFWTHNQDFVPEGIANRTPEGQKAYSKAWNTKIKSLQPKASKPATRTT
jgi:hypothetical protein